MIVEFDLPSVSGEGRFFLEDVCGIGGEHEDEFFDLSVFFHLFAEIVILDLSIEDGHCPPCELVRVSIRSKSKSKIMIVSYRTTLPQTHSNKTNGGNAVVRERI